MIMDGSKSRVPDSLTTTLMIIDIRCPVLSFQRWKIKEEIQKYLCPVR